MIYILYSTDYELFLGENYVSEKQILIDPTNTLLNTCESIGIPLTIFCDTACIWRYKELNRFEFPNQVEEQLKNAVRRQHDVQTHLHPHWLYADSIQSRWNFAPEKFLLGLLEHNDEACFQTALTLLKKAKSYLDTLLQPIRADYSCIAYRAGGFGIQPRQAIILQALHKAGYFIDSSVVPNMKLQSNVNQIDFTQMPKQANYEIGSQIFEIPIPSATVSYSSLLQELGSRILKKHPPAEWTKYGRSVQEGKQLSRIEKINIKLSKLYNRWFMLELREHADLMFEITKQYLTPFLGNQTQDIYFSLLSHSKNLSPELLESLKKYHLRLKKYYGDQIQAITFQDVIKLKGMHHERNQIISSQSLT